ncbi:aminotransferase [Devosia sp. Leaf420]|uniref:aminotransferase class I/II-fold pyridoxal phosphate-dependent enzyme n=1 Tax=Devosia sp. Leaf420 TaxID=1736374 RepID=UPI0007136362|nr:aminotransferase class I/II-fold pyridoxal phosphate-dependent enzyme [Devosia sp. Leaf420]KQT41879.1 aminotransferase [Devosia sp. Leaf420]
MNVQSISVSRETQVREVLAILNATGGGIVLLVRADGTFERTVTDGDIRRLMIDGSTIESSLDGLPKASSIVIDEKYTRRDALSLMNQHVINHLVVLDANGKAIDVVERSRIDDQILLSTPHMGESELDFVQQAFTTNWIAPLGPNVDAFENEVVELIGSKHGVAVSSGTAAIHLSLLLLGVGPEDTVFCSSLTFAASVNPIAYQGARPVLIDSEPDSWNMSPKALERALESAKRAGKLPKAVIVVNLYGQSADMDPIQELCRQYGVDIVEDAAESMGAKYKGRPSGTFGRLGIFSFNGNKIITTSGGGMLITEERELAQRARFLATQARDPAPHYQHSTIGYNYRMSNILAGVGRGQLRMLDDRVAARRAVFDLYSEGLADIDWLELMPEPEWSNSTHWLTAATIRPDVTNRSASDVIGLLSNELIEARPVWKPMHMQPVFADAQYFPHDNESVSTGLFERGFCLPSGSNLTKEQVERIIAVIRKM